MRKPRKCEFNVARVEGCINGVPFIQYFKRMASAEKVAINHNATLVNIVEGRIFTACCGKLTEMTL